MPSLQELEQALISADKAGDSTSAKAIASDMDRMMASIKSPAQPQPQEADTADKIMGHPATRFALGAASPVIGAFQFGANIGDKAAEALGLDPTVGKSVNEWVARVEDMKRRGMAARSGNKVGEDWDVAGGLGSIGSGAAALKNLPVVKTLGQKVIQGIPVGAGMGAVTPVTGGDEFFSDKAAQVGAGAVLGGIAPAAWAGTKAVGRGVRDTSDVLLPGGAKRIADRYSVNTLMGEGRDKIVDALENVKGLLPGSKPTAAEALVGLPEGSAITAHQKIVAGTPPDISTQFGQRMMDQKEALKSAILERKSITKPMRESALALANQGGVKSEPIINNIQTMQNVPGQRASDIVQKTLNSVKEKINSLTGDDGVINADDLYTVRKEVGNIIKTHAKETSNWDKKLSAGLQKDVQGQIDDAIEGAGGIGWKEYLSEFSKRSKDIGEEIARIKSSGKPIQEVNLQGGLNVAEETRTHIPQLLSRPAMMANAVMRYAGIGIEPKVDKIMAERYLNPQQFAKDIGKTPQQNMIIDAILRRTSQIAPSQMVARKIGE